MARVPINLYTYASIPTSKTEVVSAATSLKRIIRKATFVNNSGSTATVDLYMYPDGINENRTVHTKTLIDKETYSVPDVEGHVLEPAGTIDVAGSVANIQLTISAINVPV